MKGGGKEGKKEWKGVDLGLAKEGEKGKERRHDKKKGKGPILS